MARPFSLVSLILAAALTADAAPRERLDLRPVSLELPAAPAAIIPADLDGDGRRDLVVAVAYTEWDQIGIEESARMDDVEGVRPAGLVEVLTIVPALQDRREVRLFLAGETGYRPAAVLELDRSVLSLAAGPEGLPAVALTDDGLSALVLEGGALVLEPLLADRPVLAGSGTFVPELEMVHDLDGDGREDLLLPAADGAAVYLAAEDRLRPAARLQLAEDRLARWGEVRHYPLPEVRDVDGDRRPDLVMAHHQRRWELFHVLRNAGSGRFETIGPLADGRPCRNEACLAQDEDKDEDEDQAEEEEEDADEVRHPEIIFFGDLDGDGRAEYVTQEELTDDDAGWRQEIKEAKNPPFLYRFHRARPDLSIAPQPYHELRAVGYSFAGEGGDGEEEEIRLPGGFQDLDGDGRLDLVALTLDFSLLQAVRILTVQSLSIGIDFHLWCQDTVGRFRPVSGLDLSGKFRLRLDDLRLGQLSQFAGDFDGDGRADFVQMGRGKTVTIHRGRAGCSYPAAPDLTIELAEPPRDLGLVQVRDLDGDGLTDLLIIQPQRVDEPGVTPPVRLDLYLSGGEG